MMGLTEIYRDLDANGNGIIVYDDYYDYDDEKITIEIYNDGSVSKTYRIPFQIFQDLVDSSRDPRED
jgi:hypothetical protein